MPMATCVHNGNNETKVVFSQSLSIQFFDNNQTEIKITDSSQLIDIWIPRSLSLPKTNIQFLNVTSNMIDDLDKQLFFLDFNISASNSSFHLEISPLDSSIGYLILLKLNTTPIITESYHDCDIWKMFCPSGVTFK